MKLEISRDRFVCIGGKEFINIYEDFISIKSHLSRGIRIAFISSTLVMETEHAKKYGCCTTTLLNEKRPRKTNCLVYSDDPYRKGEGGKKSVMPFA